MNLLMEYIKYYVSLTPDAEQDILNAFKVNEYPGGKTILQKGDICNKLYFMLKGTSRTFFYQNEKDVTTWIYPEGYFFTSWASLLSGSPSFEFIEILENSKVAFITKQTLHNLYDKHPAVERFGRLLAEEQLAAVDDYSKGYMFLSAKEKYDLLLSFFPDVTQRVNLGHNSLNDRCYPGDTEPYQKTTIKINHPSSIHLSMIV